MKKTTYIRAEIFSRTVKKPKPKEKCCLLSFWALAFFVVYFSYMGKYSSLNFRLSYVGFQQQ